MTMVPYASRISDSLPSRASLVDTVQRYLVAQTRGSHPKLSTLSVSASGTIDNLQKETFIHLLVFVSKYVSILPHDILGLMHETAIHGERSLVRNFKLPT